MRGNLVASDKHSIKCEGFETHIVLKGLLLLLSWFGEYNVMWIQGQGGLSILQTERKVKATDDRWF